MACGAYPPYAGHGTFAAGVAKCAAPEAAVYVNNHFTESEGEAEDVIIQKLDQLITDSESGRGLPSCRSVHTQ